MVKRECREIITGIYAITNPEGKVYVGQSVDVFKRFHVYHREEYRAMGVKLYKSVEKFSSDEHFYEVLEECKSEMLDDREKYWIAKLDTKENGLNSTIGGNGLRTHSEESKQAISDALTGRISPLRGRTRTYKGRVSPNKGNKRSQESRDAFAKKMKGKEQNGRAVVNTKTNQEWISASQCAKHYNVSITTIFNYIKQDKHNLQWQKQKEKH